MVIRLFSFIVIMLLGNCEKELHELTMPRTPYTGNELRVNGYYYSSPIFKSNLGIAVFYRDGVCMHMFTRFEGQDTLGFIENDILLNEALMSRLWTTPSNIGVFQINMESIEFEIWEAGRNITTFSHFGNILNDTTFILTKWINNDLDKSFLMHQTYRFKQFSPKPDSTNNFIK